MKNEIQPHGDFSPRGVFVLWKYRTPLPPRKPWGIISTKNVYASRGRSQRISRCSTILKIETNTAGTFRCGMFSFCGNITPRCHPFERPGVLFSTKNVYAPRGGFSKDTLVHAILSLNYGSSPSTVPVCASRKQ